MLNDLHYSFRQLLKSRLFSIVSIVTIALGIGANTAIFSVVNGVLLNPLPYPDSSRIVVLFQEIANFKDGSISYPNFLDWQRMNGSFSRLAAYRPNGFNLAEQGEPQHLHGEMVSAGFFEIFGVKPVAGRTFNNEDDRRGAAPTVMISEGLWRRSFGAATNIIGQRLVLDGEDRTVIGVVPSSFRLRIENFQEGRTLVDIYTPVGEYNEPRFYNDRAAGWGLKAVGLLKPGMSLDLARQDMNRVSRELSAAYPNVDHNVSANLVALKEQMVGDMRAPLLVLLGAVCMVLLISCANVSNLLLARSISREREFAIRLAIGGGQWRIIRQLLTESILLGLIGGGLGLILAQYGTSLAIHFVPYTIPRVEDIGLDTRVLLFTLLASVLAGVAFGLAPALKMRRANLSGALRETSRGVAGSRSRIQAAFAVVEISLALVLLVGAGLMIRTLMVLWGLDPGFNPRGVLTFSIAPQASLAQQSPAAIRSYFRRVHDQLAGTPGVKAVSLSWASEPMEDDWEWHLWFAGRPKPAHISDLAMSIIYVVEPDYRKAMQIPMKAGRFLSESDDEHSAPVVVIDEALAKKYFQGEDPIGKYLDLDVDPAQPNRRAKARVVGVVNHVKQWGLDSDAMRRPLQAQIYLSINQMTDLDTRGMAEGFAAYVKGERDAAPDFEMLRQRFLLARDMVAFEPQPMEQVVEKSIANKRFSMALLASFAGLAVLLASIGIYGVLSYLVGQRTREIGIRMALGAAHSDVLGMVLKDGARMTVLGVGIGIAAALVLTRLMSSMLFGVNPTDLATFAVVALTLSAIAMLACYLPARRAMRIDPLIALRDD
jgi:predicted permease